MISAKVELQWPTEVRCSQILCAYWWLTLLSEHLQLCLYVLCSPLVAFVLGESVLEELVDWPADGCGGHLVDHPRLDPLEEALQATQPVNCLEGVGQAWDLSVGSFVGGGGSERARLLRVEQGLADIQGRGGSGGDGPGQSSGHHVGWGVVLSVGIEELLKVLVGHEVEHLEGHVHGELGGVAAVESAQAFFLPHGTCTVQHATVGRVIHLHALLHNWSHRGMRSRRNGAQRNREQEISVKLQHWTLVNIHILRCRRAQTTVSHPTAAQQDW